MDLLLTCCWNLKSAEHKALLDTGAEGLFVDERIAKARRKLITPLRVRNVDGTDNEGGRITHETRIKFRLGNEDFDEWCYVTNLGDQEIILGLPWFKRHNPLVDWRKQTIEAFNWTRDKKRYDTIMTMIRYLKYEESGEKITIGDSESEALLYFQDAEFVPTEEVWVRAKTSVATQLAQEAEERREKIVLPEFYRKFA